MGRQPRDHHRHGGGLLVLLITVLVVDQVVSIRQLNDRARAIAAQAAIVVTQARRTAQAVSQAVNPHDGQGDRDAAVDEFRTYMMMLLVAAPVLIDAKVSRDFLEQAQVLGAELAKALAETAKPADGAARRAGPPCGHREGVRCPAQRGGAAAAGGLDSAAAGARPGDAEHHQGRHARLACVPQVTGRFTEDFGRNGAPLVTLALTRRSRATRPARLPPSWGVCAGVGMGRDGQFRGG
jgi:hypothetical protein